MPILKCKMCGGDLNVTGEEKVVECEYCGSKQTIPDANDEKKVNLFNRANRLRISCDFDKASSIYEQIISEFPEEAEAYWGLCLSNYGIEYVDDPATARKIPTCHRASFNKMRKDENYELALEYADMASRIIYEDQAKEIDQIMGDILSISRDEKPYDIFICYKETDNVGNRTPDSVLAQDIYDALTSKGYRTFFSRISLEDKLGTQYEPYIFSALNSAKIMLVVGTDYEYMHAVWVKNEWSRFLKIMAKDKEKHLIPCYKDMDPYDMPDEFKNLQSQDCGKIGFIQDLVRGIDKLFGKTIQTKDKESLSTIVTSSGPQASSLLERAFMFLEDRKWDDANEYSEKVLDIEPKNANAYLVKLLASKKIKYESSLERLINPFDNDENYIKTIRFADEGLKARLEGYITTIKERIRVAEEEKRKLETEAEETKRKHEIEAEDLYQQLLFVIGKSDKNLTTGEKLVCTKKEKEDVISMLNNEISNLEKEKIDFPSLKNKIDELSNRKKDFAGKKRGVIKNINFLNNQLTTLGFFAVSQKKELNTKIENSKNVVNDLTLEIENLENEIKPLSEKMEQLVSVEDITSKINNIKANIDAKTIEFDQKIRLLEDKLKEEENSNRVQLSLDDIVIRIKNSDYIKEYIERNNTILNFPEDIRKKCNFKYTFGKYKQGKNDEIYPIEWRVLKRENNKILIISEKGIDFQKFDDLEATYSECTLRQWLNNDFLNSAFTKDEQNFILDSTVSADRNPNYKTSQGETVIDKIFLLSINETEKYFEDNQSRKCVPTDYVEKHYSPSLLKWRLRTIGNNVRNVSLVDYDGLIDYDGDSFFHSTMIRPALWVIFK